MIKLNSNNNGFITVQANALQKGDTVYQSGRQSFTVNSTSLVDGMVQIIDTTGTSHKIPSLNQLTVKR